MTTDLAKPPTQIQSARDISLAIAPYKARLGLLIKARGEDDIKRYMFAVEGALAKSPTLKGCSARSLIEAVFVAAELGLDPSGGTKGEAYLVPYKGEIQCQPGYRGLRKLCLQMPDVEDAYSKAVYRGDVFRPVESPVADVVHEPDINGDRSEKNLTHVYAVILYRSGRKHVEWMTKAEIDRIRNGSPSGNSPAWKNHYGEMARKTVLKRAIKHTLIVESEKLAKAVELDDREYTRPRIVETAQLGTAALLEQLKAPAPETTAGQPEGEIIPPPPAGEVAPPPVDDDRPPIVDDEPPPRSDVIDAGDNLDKVTIADALNLATGVAVYTVGKIASAKPRQKGGYDIELFQGASMLKASAPSDTMPEWLVKGVDVEAEIAAMGEKRFSLLGISKL